MSLYIRGPAVGIGDGTLLVGWRCRVAESTDAFRLYPLMVWVEDGRPRILAMDPDGKTTLHWATELQFDPTWKRPT